MVEEGVADLETADRVLVGVGVGLANRLGVRVIVGLIVRVKLADIDAVPPISCSARITSTEGSTEDSS